MNTLRIFGCYFHFKTNVCKAANKRLQKLRHTCHEFKRLVNMILALVWAETEELPHYWAAIKKFCDGKLYDTENPANRHACYAVWQKESADIEQFLRLRFKKNFQNILLYTYLPPKLCSFNSMHYFRYMTTTWMGNPDEEIAPKYEHGTWSATRTLLDPQIPSTQGGSESCNRQINK